MKKMKFVPIRRKLITTNFVILFVALGLFWTVISYGLKYLSDNHSQLNIDRSEVVRNSYQRISDENIQKIKSIYEKELESKGRRLLTKDSSSLASMITDNAYLSVQRFLQKTFEDDSTLELASYFTLNQGKIFAWYFTSTEYRGGLNFPIQYDLKKKGWLGKLKDGNSVFISDPVIPQLIYSDSIEIKLREYVKENEKTSGFDCLIPFVDGKTGLAVKSARAKGEAIGFLRYVISTSQMQAAVVAEKSFYEKNLISLEKENSQSLLKSQQIGSLASRRVFLVLGLFGLLVVFCGYLASIFSADRLARPIKALTKIAENMAQGNYSHVIDLQSNDEIGILASTFQHMCEAIRKRDAELADINKNLEKNVEERTATIKTILNNVKFGFLLVGKDLCVQEGYTWSCKALFDNRIKVGLRLTEILCLNKRLSEHVDVLLEQVFEDVFDESLSLGQVPSRFKLDKKTLQVEGSVVRDAANQIQTILFTIMDVTEIERVESENKVNNTLIRLLQQRTSFRDFVVESKNLIGDGRRCLTMGNQNLARMALHTLKGNSAVFGLDEIASLIHKIEDHTSISDAHFNEIENAFRDFLGRYLAVLMIPYEGDYEEVFHVKEGVLEKLRQSSANIAPQEAIMKVIHNWIKNIKRKPAGELLGPLPEYSKKLATRLGKKVQVLIKNGDLMVDVSSVKPVCQILPHLVRNAIDHGIEMPLARGEKPETSLLVISFWEEKESWGVKVSDDGRGIDVARVTQLALEKQLISPSQVLTLSEEEKCKLILHDGISTKADVTEISGRGYGMAAIAKQISNIQGEVKIKTRLGVGTSVEIIVPKST